MKLNEEGHEDILFDLRKMEDIGPAVVYSHQDHVVTMPENSILLGSASTTRLLRLEFWTRMGASYLHGECNSIQKYAKHRIERAFQWGHISEAEMLSFQRDHDGAGVLESFANVVLGHTP